VVATGFQPADPAKFSGYQFKEKDDVYTAFQIEEMVSKGEKIVLKSGEMPKSVALVHCVGRKEKGYCSKICCSTLMKIAGYFKEQFPKIEIKEYFGDLCLPNKEDQTHFEEVQNGGVAFIRFKKINVKGSHIQYTGMDDLQKEASFDMIVLAAAMEPGEDTEELAEMLGVSLNETGFFQEAHQTINPVSTTTEGVYIIGAAHGPRGISSSILTAQAAAGKILTMLIPGEKIIPEVKVSEILESFCTGCKTCLDICCYGAITYDENRGISVVNEAVCRGCGNCAGSCPSGAIRAKHFTSFQLYQEVIEAVR
jgi:heterodisulfide reductase subunit A